MQCCSCSSEEKEGQSSIAISQRPTWHGHEVQLALCSRCNVWALMQPLQFQQSRMHPQQGTEQLKPLFVHWNNTYSQHSCEIYVTTRSILKADNICNFFERLHLRIPRTDGEMQCAMRIQCVTRVGSPSTSKHGRPKWHLRSCRAWVQTCVWSRKIPTLNGPSPHFEKSTD